MARVGTSKFNLGMWEQGENPSAGSQDASTYASNTALNGNWAKIEAALTQHKTTGVHEDDIIDGSMLKTTAGDGTSIEVSGSPRTIKVRSDAAVDANRGINTNYIRDAAITTAKIANDAVDNTKLKDDASVDANRAVTTNHIRDAAVTTAKIADAAVTSAKLSTDVQIGSYIVLFNDTRVAATGAGSAAAVATEWGETAVTDVIKVRIFAPTSHLNWRYITARFSAKTTNASYAWTATMTCIASYGGNQVTKTGSDTGTNTAYELVTGMEGYIQLDTWDGGVKPTGYWQAEIQLALRSANVAATASIRNLNIMASNQSSLA